MTVQQEGIAETALVMVNEDDTIRAQCLASLERVAQRKAAATGLSGWSK
jgi:hypothetical protein